MLQISSTGRAQPRAQRGQWACRTAAVVLGSLSVVSCASFRAQPPPPGKVSPSPGEQASGYSYVPLDPLPVKKVRESGCSENAEYKPVLESLPDNAVRVAVRELSAKGQLSFGPLQVGTENKSYQVILDYVNVDTSSLFLTIGYVKGDKLGSIYESGMPKDAVIRVERLEDQEGASEEAPVQGDQVVVPVYVGVGLRLTATVNVLKGSVNLSSLGAIAAQADAGNVTGSMVVQTLGIAGEQVSTSLPLPSALNSTTVQNAILSLGAIKAILYDENSVVTPRVVGIYNPIGTGGQRLINAIVSEMAESRIVWHAPCEVPKEPTSPSASQG